MSDDSTAGFAGGMAGAYAASAEHLAADEMRVGMQAFVEAAKRLELVDFEQSKGNLFEYIEAARFNADAASKGSQVRANVTAAIGRPTAPADIEISHGRRVLREVQAKVSNSHSRLAHSIKDPKYDGMQRLVPKDAEGRVNELVDQRANSGSIFSEQYADAQKNLSGELSYDSVSSGGTTRSELESAHQDPRMFAANSELKAVANEAKSAGVAGAATGAIIGGAISSVKSAYRFQRNEISGEEAIAEIAWSTAKGGVRGGATGAGGAVVSHVAAKAGLRTVAKSNIATTIAASVIDCGTHVYAYGRGEIDGVELAGRLGDTGVSTMSSIYVGAAAGAVFGPPGMLVGSVAGYMISSNTYASVMAVLKDAELAEAEAERLGVLAEEAIQQLAAQRRLIERQIDASLQSTGVLQQRLEQFRVRVEEGDPLAAVILSQELVQVTGATLKFQSFSEFDVFMSDTDSGPLVL